MPLNTEGEKWRKRAFEDAADLNGNIAGISEKITKGTNELLKLDPETRVQADLGYQIGKAERLKEDLLKRKGVTVDTMLVQGLTERINTRLQLVENFVPGEKENVVAPPGAAATVKFNAAKKGSVAGLFSSPRAQSPQIGGKGGTLGSFLLHTVAQRTMGKTYANAMPKIVEPAKREESTPMAEPAKDDSKKQDRADTKATGQAA
ncbi:MAG: hypothetical protein O2904_04950 [bacterium]|nr:hypothetical protein [bacterium]